MMVQKSDQKSEKDEKFEQLKKQASSLENSLKLSKTSSFSLFFP